MDFPALVQDYGYYAVFFGTLLEGEVILVLAGMAAHAQKLSLPAVIAIATVGGFLGDQFFFVLGRRFGAGILQNKPHWQPRVDKVNTLLDRYHAPLIIMIRFMYGLRIIGPIVIGMSNVPRWRLALFNFIGAMIWAPLIAGGGYLFGHVLETFFAHMEHAQRMLLALLLMGGIAAWVIVRRKK
ncbi:MAG: DedA family protein [Burkholderiales bacterium]